VVLISGVDFGTSNIKFLTITTPYETVTVSMVAIANEIFKVSLCNRCFEGIKKRTRHIVL
jgi:hypothetical protein